MNGLNPRLVLAGAVLIGAAGGYHLKTRTIELAEARAKQQALHQTAVGVVAATARSQTLETAVDRSNAMIDQIDAALHTRPLTLQPPKENHNAFAPSVVAVTAPLPTTANNALPPATVANPACSDFVLDLDTVRLLNLARSGADLDTVTGGDEALGTASSITVSALIDNDLQIVKLYHELAKRHDALVSEVEAQLQQQAAGH